MANEQYADAIDLLQSDHKKVDALFQEFENSDDVDQKQVIASQICTELKIHTMIEEELFYPAFEGKLDEGLFQEAVVEHDGAKVLVNDIETGDPSDEFYDAKVHVLSEEIEHHVKEEEEEPDGMFAQCRRTDVDLVALGEQMLARKQELVDLAETNGLPPAKLSAVEVLPS